MLFIMGVTGEAGEHAAGVVQQYRISAIGQEHRIIRPGGCGGCEHAGPSYGQDGWKSGQRYQIVAFYWQSGSDGFVSADAYQKRCGTIDMRRRAAQWVGGRIR